MVRLFKILTNRRYTMNAVSTFILVLLALGVVVILTGDTTAMDAFFVIFGN